MVFFEYLSKIIIFTKFRQSETQRFVQIRGSSGAKHTIEIEEFESSIGLFDRQKAQYRLELRMRLKKQ